jgi:uncharacterized OB-fold protein
MWERVDVVDSGRRKIPLKEGLFTVTLSPDDRAQLIGSRCLFCGEVTFPKRKICPNCHKQNMKEVKLSQRGKIYSVTVVMQRPPVYYRGPVPYAMGFVELPDGVRVQTLFTGCDPDALRIGMDAELVIDRLYEDDKGNEILTYKFRPVDT